jgi:hypothetical protein
MSRAVRISLEGPPDLPAIEFGLTAAEFREVRRAARADGVSIQDFVRWALLRGCAGRRRIIQAQDPRGPDCRN